MKEKLLVFLGRLGSSLYFRLHLYRAISKFYQFFFERRRESLYQYQDLAELVKTVRTFKWRADTWRQLWDTISHPEHVQWLANNDPRRFVGDCLPEETLVLKKGYETVKIADLKVGDFIMGDGRWVEVKAVVDKGVLPVNKFSLANGSSFCCTADHKLFKVPKDRGYAGDRAEAFEERASEIAPDDDLLTPEEFPAGEVDMDPEEAWVWGLFVADGWIEYDKKGAPFRVAFSGKDGCRKEANKERVKAFFDKREVPVYWADRYLRINSRDWAQKFSVCGRRAPNKKFPTVNVTPRTAAAFLEGVNADADVRDHVLTTTSEQLSAQVRILYRIVGKSCRMTKIYDHGGVGTNPIYRVAPRHEDTRRPFHRVRAIAPSDPCKTVDITVEGGRFYLPESDIIVHNCDDFASYEAQVFTEQFQGSKWQNLTVFGAEILTVMWRGEKYGGHNVCLIKFLDGKSKTFYCYMDYGWPSKIRSTVQEVVKDVMDRYAPTAVSLGWARTETTTLKPLEVSWK